MSSRELLKRIEDITISITLLGGLVVGKTSISNRLIGNDFKEDYIPTIGNEKLYRDFDHKNNRKITVRIWDTAGQERLRSIAIRTIRTSKGVIFVYDITNRKSFEEMKSLFYETKEKISDLKSIIFGNKSDLYLYEEVTEEEGKKFADEMGAIFCLVSAKNNDNNIEKSFQILIDQILTDIYFVEEREIKLRKEQRKRKTECCFANTFTNKRKLSNCERCLTCCGYYACKLCLKNGFYSCLGCLCGEKKCTKEACKNCYDFVVCGLCCSGYRFNEVNDIGGIKCCYCCHCPKEGNEFIYDYLA